MRYVRGLAFLVLLIGAYMLAERLFVWDAALFVVIALLILAGVGARYTEGRLRVKAWLHQAWPPPAGTWMRIGSLALSGVVALVARRRVATEGFGALLALWCFALLLFLFTVIGPALRDQCMQCRLSRTERWGLAALLVAAFLVRAIGVGWIPANLGGDEGTQLTAALDLVSAPLGNPFATGWYSVPTMTFLAYGAAMRLFGATVAGGRMLSVLAGTLSVLTTFLLARTVSGRRAGWAAATMLAFSAYHIHFSRLASNQVADPLIGTLAVWLVWRAMAPETGTRSPRQAQSGQVGRLGMDISSAESYWALAGVVTGLGWYAYFGARWTTGIAALVVLWRCLVDRTQLRRHWRGLLLFGLAWLVVTLPLWGWYSVNPSALYERYSMVGVFASGWMDREQVLTGRSVVSLLWQQIWRSATAFHLTRDPTFWYRPDRPLVDFVTGALLLLGIADALLKVRWPSRGLAHLWFWPTLMLAWGLTENPPSSQRGLLLLPPVALFVAWGIERLATLLGPPRRTYPVVATALLAVVATMNLTFYFGVYTPSEVYGNPTAQTATRFAAFMRANPEPICDAGSAISCSGKVYFLGQPWLYWDFGSLSFLLRGYPGVDVAQGELPVEVTQPARFAVVPERAEQTAEILARWPGGTESRLYAPDGRLLMWIYDWSGDS